MYLKKTNSSRKVKFSECIIIAGFLLLYLAGCTPGKQDNQNENKQNSEELRTDSIYLSDFLKIYDPQQIWAEELYTFYRNRNYSLAWFQDGRLKEYAPYLSNMIQADQEHPEIELLNRLDSVTEGLDYLPQNTSQNPLRKKYAEYDFILSLLFFQYAEKHWAGIPQKDQIKTHWHIQRKTFNYPLVLKNFLEGNTTENFGHTITYSQYGALENYLKKYNEIEAGGGWPNIQYSDKTLKTGDTSELIFSISKYLHLTGDIQLQNTSGILDENMSQALRAFQERHGLKITGNADPETFRALSVPIHTRIRQIRINMERARWVPREPQGTYIAINIPDFKMYVFDHQKLLWTCRVIVGHKMHKTVIFNQNLKYIVFSPNWNIPRSILNQEIIPAQKKNPSYLLSHNMEIYTDSGQIISPEEIDWSRLETDFPYKIRQKPGGNNALGRVKFMFPNEHNIYLHDTPAKSLFLRQMRASSHGCIRVQEPVKLTQYLLRNHPDWTDEKIESAMNQNKEQIVSLNETIPVFIAYFTCWVDTKGKIQFRDDVYLYDQKLENILFQP